MKTSFFALGWRTLWRDVRAGELRLLIVAVTLAVAALTAVGFFADRLKGGLARDARQLLGGDAVVSSDNPTPQAFIERARALGLQSVTTLGFPTMGRAPDAQGGASKLVALKVVDTGYPLRGSLRVAPAPEAPGQPTREVPAPGEAWVDAPLLDALGLKMGDALMLGDVSLRIGRIIVTEPDRGAGFMSFAPRVMINQADIAATRLVQPASKASANAQHMANAAAAESEQRAASNKRGKADYANKIRGKVRGNIVLPPGIQGNPEAIFEVNQLPSGEVLDVKLKRSSGNPGLDSAIERALLKSSPLPKPDDPALFQRTLEIKYKPFEE